MIQPEWMLTDEEIDEIDNSLGSEDWRFGEAVAEAQDAKTYPIGYADGKRDARKEIGEWLERMRVHKVYPDEKFIAGLEALLRGEMPKEKK